MKNLIILSFILMMLNSCSSYENPAFVVVNIGQCFDNGLTNYTIK